MGINPKIKITTEKQEYPDMTFEEIKVMVDELNKQSKEKALKEKEEKEST